MFPISFMCIYECLWFIKLKKCVPIAIVNTFLFVYVLEKTDWGVIEAESCFKIDHWSVQGITWSMDQFWSAVSFLLLLLLLFTQMLLQFLSVISENDILVVDGKCVMKTRCVAAVCSFILSSCWINLKRITVHWYWIKSVSDKQLSEIVVSVCGIRFGNMIRRSARSASTEPFMRRPGVWNQLKASVLFRRLRQVALSCTTFSSTSVNWVRACSVLALAAILRVMQLKVYTWSSMILFVCLFVYLNWDVICLFIM